MSNSIPPEVLAVLNEFNEGLKQLKNAAKEFTSIPFEEMQAVGFIFYILTLLKIILFSILH